MRSATSSIPVSRAPGRRRLGAFGAGAALAALAAGILWWTAPPRSAITAAQIVALWPSGSALHSLARLDLDGASPQDAAAVVAVPRFPGAAPSGYVEVIARYDRWRHRLELIYQQPQPSAIPISVDAGRILGDRDGALFQTLREDGAWSYRIVGLGGLSVRVLAEGETAERIRLADPLVIDRGAGRALVWAGIRFTSRAMPPLESPPPALTWRFAMRNGMVVASTNHVTLRPRQILRVQAVGGGTTPIVIADSRFDVVENGFRARHAGTYSIRVLAAYTPTESAYVLTVFVSEPPP
jgi:hypothetical protein